MTDFPKQPKITWADIERRKLSLGLTSGDSSSLAELAPHAQEFADKFYVHLRRFKEPAALLRSEEFVSRLKRTQIDYFKSTLRDDLDRHYVATRFRVGEVHQRVGLRPNWYISTFSLYLNHLLPLLERYCGSREQVSNATSTLIRRVFFDMSLALDAYSIKNEQVALESPEPSGPDEPTAPHFPKKTSAAARFGQRSGINVSQEDLEERRVFHELTDEALATLKANASTFESLTPRAVEALHELIRANEIKTIEPISEASLSRLEHVTQMYWSELYAGKFDRQHSITRVRIGMVHERIGVSLQWYLVALAVQLTTLTSHAFEVGVSMDAIIALTRATMFDMTYVVDAYMEARIANLLKHDGFASLVVGNMTTGVLLIDENLRIRSVNSAALPLLGLPPETLSGMYLGHAIPNLPQDFVDATTHGPAEEVDIRHRIGDREVRLRLMSIKGEESQRLAVLLDDLSAAIDMLQRTETAHEDYQQIMDRLGLASWEADIGTGMIEFVTAALDELVAAEGFGVLGRKTVQDAIVAAADKSKFIEAWHRAVAGEGVELEHRIPPGSQDRWVRTWMRKTTTSTGEHRIHGDVREVTESVHVRRELAQRLELQRHAVEYARDSMSGADDEEPIRLLLRRLSEVEGIERARLFTKSVGGWNEVACSDPRAESSTHILDRLTDETLVQARVVGPDDEDRRSHLTVPIPWDSTERALIVVSNVAGNSFTAAYREFAETMAALGAAWIERWMASRRAAEKQRLDLLGTLACGVAHDLNNALGIIQLSASELRHDDSPTRDDQARIDDILSAVARGSALTHDILVFARGDDTVAPAEMREALPPLARLLRAAIPASITLDIVTESGALIALGRPQLEQIVINLATNAANAVGTRHITIRTSEITLLETEPVIHGELGPGAFIILTVEDDGPGVPVEIRERIFEPFFSTRRDSGGTGLGLSMSAHLAYEGGGGLRLAPQQPAVGARFEIWLKKLEPDAERQPPTLNRRENAHSSEGLRLLLAEDETAIRSAFARILTRRGHHVRECENGEIAIASLSDDLDIVIADFSMPGVSGIEVLRAAAARCPNARLICSSGQNIELPDDLIDRGVIILQKPFGLAELIEVVESSDGLEKKRPTK